ncbi:MAG: UvrD-helicase domain-containing protein, partial [bacterium]|nr:UvrD-helicase domain-containing protein [bacterium]
MLDVFYKKLKNNEYISNILYENIFLSYPDKIPSDFNIDEYNNNVLEKKYIEYYDYFLNMYKNIDDKIKLDKDQIKAILAEEDYSLIIAGAGTGKTTTVTSLVKYLVDIKHIEPEKIVVISYTKKATQELEKRIQLDFNIPASITTFHSLGMMYIRKIFSDRKCLIVDENYRRKIFMEYFEDKLFKDKNKIKEILDIFPMPDNKNEMFTDFFKENYNEYEDYETLFKAYKKDKRNKIVDLKQEVDSRIDKLLNNDDCILTINHEIVKSKGEALIANFLYCNNIPYKYEKVYKDIMEDRRIYKPDFTLDLGGDEVYLEYFGLSDYKANELSRYNKIRKIKEDYHKTHHTRFISLGCDKNKNIITELKNHLINMGFKLVPKSYEEIFDRLLDNKKSSLVYGFRDFMYNNIEVIKTSINRQNYLKIVNNYINTLKDNDKIIAEKQFYYINDFYLYYQKKLYGGNSYKFDFSDMIYYANKYIENIPK